MSETVLAIVLMAGIVLIGYLFTNKNFLNWLNGNDINDNK